MSKPAYFHSNIEISERISNYQTIMIFTKKNQLILVQFVTLEANYSL